MIEQLLSATGHWNW